MRSILTLSLAFSLLFLFGTPEAYAQKAEFRKGIKTHNDWIERLKSNKDYRIFKMLASRAGRVIDSKRATEVCEYLKKYPDKFDEVLEKWGITMDRDKFESEVQNKWRKQYGDQALILSSKHYLTLATKRDSKNANRLKYYMEKIFKLYQKKFKTDEHIEGRFVLKLYPNKSDFMATKAPSFAFAYFRASSRELVGYVPDSIHGNSKPHVITDALVTTFFHEGFHQFLSYYVPDPPTWLNEGFACLFEAVRINGKSISEGKMINHNRLYWLRRYIQGGQVSSLKSLVYMSQAELYRNPNVHYPQSWGLTHFLVYGSKKYHKYFKGIMTHLKNGMDRKEALDEVFANVKWDIMEKAWRHYIKKVRSSQKKNKYI